MAQESVKLFFQIGYTIFRRLPPRSLQKKARELVMLYVSRGMSLSGAMPYLPDLWESKRVVK
jgi:hypothetical protein